MFQYGTKFITKSESVFVTNQLLGVGLLLLAVFDIHLTETTRANSQRPIATIK